MLLEMSDNMKRPIGILDSGIGGVTVLKEIIKLLPSEDYIYYSDSIHNPYGEKTKEEVFEYVDNIVNYFISNNCKAVVIACNTATALTIDKIRNKYKDLIIIGIEPAYKMVHDYHKTGKTLVMATPATIDSEKFLKLYHNYDNGNTILKACPGLANLIENGKEEEIRKYLEKNLPTEKIESVVLGCTHYPLIKNEIKEVLGDVTFFDGGKGVANRLLDLLKNNDLLTKELTKSNISFYDSSNLENKKTRFYELLK